MLPSRNAILSEDILREHIKERDKQERFINGIEALLEQACAYEAYQIFQRPAESRGDIEDETVKKLIRLFEDLEKKEWNSKDMDEDDRVSLGKFGKDISSKSTFDREATRTINNMWKNWRETFSSGMDPEKYIPIIQKFQNDIFYMSADWKEQPGQEFAASLKGIKLETCRNLVRECVTRQIFDDPNDSRVLNGLLGKGLIGEYCFLYLLRQLPFFRMCEEFETTSLHDGLLTSKGEKRSKYERDPFAWACFDIRKQAVELDLVSWEKKSLIK